MKSQTAKKKPTALPVKAGLRLTKQRQTVYNVLIEKRDHPTAHDVYLRARKKLPAISLATVYNCLVALVAHGLVRQSNVEREISRYCPNDCEHGHFINHKTGEIFDICLKKGFTLEEIFDFPSGAIVSDFEINFKGEIC